MPYQDRRPQTSALYTPIDQLTDQLAALINLEEVRNARGNPENYFDHETAKAKIMEFVDRYNSGRAA